MEYFFTADEHFNHANIIKYCNRPFSSVEEMNEILIQRHNIMVPKKGSMVIHAGDFAFGNYSDHIKPIIDRLNGTHIWLKGSHDHWMKSSLFDGKIIQIWKKRIDSQLIVVCHYAMRTWAESHYNSWHLYGHSHGELPSMGKSIDIGVDTNNFYPYHLEEIKIIMETKSDNPNLVKNDK